jgi:hypothetical protein
MMSEPLYVRVEQSFRGDKTSIVKTLDGLVELLQQQIAEHVQQEYENPKSVSHNEFLEIIEKQSARLAKTFKDAGPAFEAAVQPNGSPGKYASAYGALLGDVRSAIDAVRSVSASASMKRTEEAYTNLLQPLLDQLKSWPAKLRAAAVTVRGNRFDLTLEAKADVDALDRALLEDTKNAKAKMFFHPSTPVDAIVDAIRAKAKELGIDED